MAPAPEEPASVSSPDPSPIGSAAAETTGASVASGGAWRLMAYLLPQVYTLVISIVAARFLGPSDMGRQSFIAFAALSVTMLFSGGLPNALMRFISEERGKGRDEVVRALVRWAWRLEVVAAAIGALLLAAVAASRPALQAAWLLAGIGAVLGILQNVPASVLTGLQRFREASVASFYLRAASTAATVLVLVLGGGITGMFAVEAGAAVVGLAWTQRLARRSLALVAPVAAPAPDTTRAATRFALIASVQVLLTFVIWRRSEFFFLERFSTPEQIAFYSVAFAAVNAVMRVPQALASVISPAFATLFGAGALDRLTSGFARALRLVVLLSIAITGAMMGLGPALLRLLYGSGYEGTGEVVMIAAMGFPIIPACGIASALMAAVGEQRLPLIAGMVATLVNVGLAFALVPPHGAVGAASANLVAQLVAGLPVLYFTTRRFGPVCWHTRHVANAVLASSAAGAIGWASVRGLGDAAGVGVGSALGVLILAVASTKLAMLSTADRRWIEESFGQRLPEPAVRFVRALATTPTSEAQRIARS